MAISTIPFGGFYNSIHDSEIDNTLERMFSDRDTGNERNEGLEQAFYRKCDFSVVHLDYAKAYAEAFADKFEIKAEFESMSSPKEYNFTTDRIFITIADSEVVRLHSLVKADELDKVAKERFTSYDGFSSSYSNDVGDWGPVAEWDHNQIGALIQAYVNQESDSEFDQYSELSLMESFTSNGGLDSSLDTANPEAARLYKIHDYLENRKERK
jgi:hypothetical protein